LSQLGRLDIYLDDFLSDRDKRRLAEPQHKIEACS
jgi:hypothetical protein